MNTQTANSDQAKEQAAIAKVISTMANQQGHVFQACWSCF
jgi:hypothetical protein